MSRKAPKTSLPEIHKKKLNQNRKGWKMTRYCRSSANRCPKRKSTSANNKANNNAKDQDRKWLLQRLYGDVCVSAG